MLGFLSAKVWASIIGVGAIVAVGFFVVHKIEQAALAEAEVKTLKAKIKRERKIQGVVNDAVQTFIDNMAGVNAGLSADLEWLRNRPARRLQAAEVDCKGGTGAELSGPDAGFLAREAARADTLRNALKACYSYADALQ